MTLHRLTIGLLGAAAFLFPACGGSGASSSSGGGGAMDLVQSSNGFGQLLPYTVKQLNAQGQPTQTIVSIRSDGDLLANVTPLNPVLPPPLFPTTAILPSGAVGNQFMYSQFTEPIDINSVLDSSPAAQSNSGLTGAITMVEVDSTTGAKAPAKARVLVNGYTYAGTPDATTGLLPLQHWVQTNPDAAAGGQPQALVVNPDGEHDGEPCDQFPTLPCPGLGFPGVLANFTGSNQLVSPQTIVFVADDDGDLTTYDTFSPSREINMRMSTAVKSTAGQPLIRQALASTTLGTDTLKPEVATTPPPNTSPVISPGQGDTDVDPLTDVRVEFTEAIQPTSLGSLPTGTPPVPSAAMSLQFGPSAATVSVPFTVFPVSVFDLSTYRLNPAFNFPGEGPPSQECGVFNTVTVIVNPGQFVDLAPTPNPNLLGATTDFSTGEGPGLVNAPVTPDTIYVGRSGAVPGLSVVDLNGFGQSTGNPTFSTATPVVEGNSNFPNNPNVRLQGALLRPALAPGTCTINGGSAGVFTLTVDSSLQDLVLRAPMLASIGDMMLGHALDRTFNNGPAPFGCQANGGNFCAFDGKKIINPVANGFSMIPVQTGQVNGVIGVGAENLGCWAPHPNPPPLVFPPICVSPFINGQEPTSVDSINPPPPNGTGAGLTNLLAPGTYFGDPVHNIPPSGLLTPEQNTYFEGPGIPLPTITPCAPYMVRQQVGHFLYIVDRLQHEIVVVNSNRMTIIDRIPLPDPTSLAMSPNLNLLAVSNQLGNLVTFIDIDPASSTFHQVVHETVVGTLPRGLAWDPLNEDILVCNEIESTVSILSAANLEVRKVVSSQLNLPFDVAITPRQLCWGFNRYVYFGYILNRNGSVAMFESGPNTVNGWGYDNVIGIATSTFQNPKAIQPDPDDLRSAVWIAHEGPINPQNGQPGQLGIPALSKLVIQSGTNGIIPLNINIFLTPQFRDLFLGVEVSLGANDLTGLPVDIAFDNQRSYLGVVGFATSFSIGFGIPINGKQTVRFTCAAGVQPTSHPRYLFVAIPNPVQGTGVVDVIRIDQGNNRIDTNPFHPGVQSIPAPNVQVLMDYFRQ
jgi:hypothetical protein